MKMNTQILEVAKGHTTDTLTTFEVMQVFRDSEDLEEIKAAVRRAQDRLFLPWASVDARDKDGERIPIEEIIGQQDTLIKRNGPISDHHTNKIHGQTMAFKVMVNPKVQKLGVLQLNKIFDDNPHDDTIWAETVSGKRKGVSVGGFNESFRFEFKDGKATKVLENFHQVETASCFDPTNQHALTEAFSVVAKGQVRKGKDKLFDALDERMQMNRKIFDDAYREAYPEGKEEEESTEKGYTKKEDHVKKEEYPDVVTDETIILPAEPEEEMKGESVISKNIQNNSISNDNTNKGDDLMPEENVNKGDILKAAMDKINKGEPLSDAEKSTLQESVELSKTKKADDEKRKADDESTESEAPKEDEDTKKGEVATSIPGEKDAAQEESPEPESSGAETNVFKSEMTEIMKAQSEMIKSQAAILEQVKKSNEHSLTPRGVAERYASMEVGKSETDYRNTPLEIATLQKRPKFPVVNKMHRKHLREVQGMDV